MRNRGATGTAAELIAAAQLISLGFYVYRCESPHSPFDLVAYRDGQLVRVEVKSLTRSLNDQHCPGFATPRNNEWDLLVIVDHRDAQAYLFDTVAEARAGIREIYGYTDTEPVLLACGHTVIHVNAHNRVCTAQGVSNGR